MTENVKLTQEEMELVTNAAIAVNGYFPDDLVKCVEKLIEDRNEREWKLINEIGITWQSQARRLAARLVAAEERNKKFRDAVEKITERGEEGAGVWGTCSHEWINIRELREALDELDS